MGDLSAHFSLSEFVDRRTGCGPEPPERLIAALELLRSMVGVPLVIVSGHRCPSTNAEVGGAAASRHLVGDAVDLVAGVVLLRQAEAAGFVGIGTKGRWAIHVDMRRGAPARWSY